MLQKVGQIVCKASECDLKFRACVLHPKQALHRETFEGVAIIPHLVVLNFERAEPRTVGSVLVAFGRHYATLCIGDVGFKHEHAIEFGVVVGVDVVLVALLEILLHHLPYCFLLEDDVVLATRFVPA